MFVLLKLLLDMAYLVYVGPQFGYAGFAVRWNILKLAESYVLVMAAAAFLPRLDESKVSTLALRGLLLLVFLPMLTLFGWADQPRLFTYLCVGGFILTMLVIHVVPTASSRRNTIPRRGIVGAALCASAIIVGMLMMDSDGLSLQAFRFGPTIYEIRAATDWGHAIMAYLVPWQARVLNVFLLNVGCIRRRWLLCIAGLLGAALVFATTAHKSYLFAPLLALLFIVALKRKRPFRLVAWTTAVAIIGSLLIYAAGISQWPASVGIRRTLFVPAQITYEYYDFFSEHQPTYLSQSHLKGLLGEENPYEEYRSIAYMMGETYAGNPNNHRNTGYLGSAYMNFGAIGVPIVSLLLGAVLVLLDSLTHGRGTEAEKALLLTLLVSVVNAALLTSMATHGLGVGIMLVWVYRRASFFVRRQP